jgi:hypothetical protein
MALMLGAGMSRRRPRLVGATCVIASIQLFLLTDPRARAPV